MKEKNAVVVGAGISGLFAALVLAKNGWRVKLIEKEARVGGVCRSYEIDGYVVDTGPHVITQLNDGIVSRFMRRYLTLLPNFVEHGEYYIRCEDASLKKLPLDIVEFLSTDILPKRDKPKIAVALAEGIAKMSVDPSKMNVSLWHYLKKYKLSKNTMKLVDAIAYFLSGVSMRSCPAWRFFTGSGFCEENPSSSFRDTISKKVGNLKKAMIHDGFPDQGYPVGGIQSIVDAVLHSFEKLDVNIKTSEKVERINIDGDAVSSVETDKGEYEADIVIYAADLKNLPAMASDFPESFVKKVRTLKSTTAITVWIGFRDVKNHFNYRGSEIYYEGKAPFWAMCTSNFDPSLAPKGRKLVGFGSVVRGRSARQYQKLLIDEIFSIYDGMEENVEMMHIQTLRPEKAAVTVNSKFPGVKTGVRNLFCVGTDVDNRSMGVTRATYSVVEMAKAIKIW